MEFWCFLVLSFFGLQEAVIRKLYFLLLLALFECCLRLFFLAPECKFGRCFIRLDIVLHLEEIFGKTFAGAGCRYPAIEFCVGAGLIKDGLVGEPAPLV